MVEPLHKKTLKKMASKDTQSQILNYYNEIPKEEVNIKMNRGIGRIDRTHDWFTIRIPIVTSHIETFPYTTIQPPIAMFHFETLP